MILDVYNPCKDGVFEKDDHNKYYDCTLNQTDIKTNKNKFYIMQLVKDGQDYVVYIRYGRVGVKGIVKTTKYTNKRSAVNYFEKQFRSKTGNWWGTNKFVERPGKYFLSDISYEKELSNIELDKKVNIPKTKLSKKIYTFLKMISNIDIMNQTLIELEIDTEKMPLGKITEAQINRARDILNKLEDVTDIEKVTDLSSKYYTYIPIACGRNKPPLIKDKNIVQRYRSSLNELSDVVVGVNIIKGASKDTTINPIDNIYKDINTKIKTLRKTTKMYKNIQQFIENTHGPTHGCKLELLDIFAVEQANKKVAYDAYTKDIDNKMLLFHGTPQSCILSIFKKDFYLDPSKLGVQIAGKMFGYGVYFADCATKSFNYTRAKGTDNIGCLLVAEVALGNMYERKDADYSINKRSLNQINCDSTKGIGRWAPVEKTTIGNVSIPNGAMEEVDKNTCLRYNEYIVYDINQVLIKYVCIVRNNGNYNGW